MDWIAIGVAALTGAIGGVLGGFAGYAFTSRNLRIAVTVAVAIGAAALGRAFITPYAEVEYLLRWPSPEMKSLIALSPQHVPELKAMLVEAYQRGGSHSDFERAGQLWGRKYAANSIVQLLASRNDALVLASFDRYMRIFHAVMSHDRVLCYDWLEGIGTPTSDAIGLGDSEKADIVRLLGDASLLSNPANAPVRDVKLDPKVQEGVVTRIRQSQPADALDFDDLAAPKPSIPNERKAKVCSTAYALYSEIQKLPVPDRLQFLRGLFGHN